MLGIGPHSSCKFNAESHGRRIFKSYSIWRSVACSGNSLIHNIGQLAEFFFFRGTL